METTQVTNPDEFGTGRTRLFDGVRAQAANGGPVLKVGAGTTNISASQTLNMLMQCTPDLSEDECDNCLQKAAQESLNCCGAAPGVRVLMPSCNLRYELYSFYNDSRLRELKILPLSLASPPTPSPPTPAGTNDNNTSLRFDEQFHHHFATTFGACFLHGELLWSRRSRIQFKGVVYLIKSECSGCCCISRFIS